MTNLNTSDILHRLKGKGKLTKSQLYWLEKLKGFGGEQTYEMMGRNVWISGKNYEGRKWYDGQSYYGKIGPRGKLDLTLQCYKDVKITDDIGVKVYLLKG